MSTGNLNDSVAFVDNLKVRSLTRPVGQCVLTAATIDHVVATNRNQQIVAAAAFQNIIAGQPHKNVVPARTVQQLIRTQGDQHIVAICSVGQRRRINLGGRC